MEIFADHAELGTLLAGLFVIPSVELQAPLDEKRTTFFEVFAGDFGLASPHGNVDEGCLFALLAAIGRVGAVDREADVGHGAAFGSVFDLGITGEITEEHDFVVGGHGG